MGFHRSVSPSPPIKRSLIPTEVDENEVNYNQIRGNTTPKHKKPTKRNYMSPTISAASKITPRKKILAERNEVLSDADETKNPVLGEPKSPPQVLMASRPSSDDDGDNKPYDPLTNFLSPRPRFLRYNPNRRREILRDLGTGDEDVSVIGGSVSSDSDSSSLSTMIAGEIRGLSQADEEEYRLTSEVTMEAREEETNEEEIKEEEEEIKETNEEETKEEEEEEEEIEEIKETNEDIEEEEEEEGSSEGGLKTNLLLLVLGLAAMFVLSVNCSASSWGLRFEDGIESGHYRSGNSSVEAFLAKSFESGDGLSQKWAFEKKEIEGLNAVEERVIEDGLKSLEDSEDPIERSDHELKKSPEDSNSGEIGSVEVVEVEESRIGGIGNEVFEQVVEDPKLLEDGLEVSEKPEREESDSFVSPESNPIEEVALNIGETTTTDETENKNGIESLEKTEPEFAVKVLASVVSFTLVAACCLSLKSKSNSKWKPPKKAKEEEVQALDQVYSFADSSFAPSTEKPTEDEYSQGNAPSVEFLGEFTVGEVSSANKTFARKAGYYYGSEFSIEGSPLYRSFSPREEDLGDGEANTASRRSSRKSDNKASAMTPVRRSTRIRNLSIKSP